MLSNILATFLLPSEKNNNSSKQTTAKKDENKFTIDNKALQKITEYLRLKVNDHRDKINAFCKARGFEDPDYGLMLAWWPGFEIVEKELGTETLQKAGIPMPKDGKSSSWKPPGVVCRLGKGLKLQYIKNGETIKRASHGAKTFPYPKLPEGTRIVLVEGELDSISCIYAGISEAVGIGGLQGIGNDDAKLLHQYEEIILLLDNDDPGKKACEILPCSKNDGKPLSKIILDSGYKGTLKRALITSEKDVDDLIKKGKKEEIFKAIENAEIIKPPEKKQNKEATISGRLPFRFLGNDEKSYYFLPDHQNTIIAMPRGNNGMKKLVK